MPDVEEKKTALVPFGKYKGQPMELLLADQPYLDWLTSQDWFRQKYQNIYAVIINYPGKPVETPDHNRMQVKFLSREYQLRLAVRVFGTAIFKWNQSYFDQNINVLLEKAKSKHQETYGASDYLDQKLRDPLSRLDRLKLLTITSPVFEDKGTDVSNELTYGYGNLSISDDEQFYAPEFFRALWNLFYIHPTQGGTQANCRRRLSCRPTSNENRSEQCSGASNLYWNGSDFGGVRRLLRVASNSNSTGGGD